MVISKHVTEFAGLPVQEYDPAVGIVLPLMPRRELHSADQFWAITLEGDRLTVQSGKVGTAGRSSTKKFKSPEQSQAEYRKLVAKQVTAGFGPPQPAAREFQLVEGKSAKFWAVEVQGESYTVRYGRIGTAGQTQTKELGSPAEARKAAQKLIAEKVAKGYAEKAAPAPQAGSLLGALYAALQANPDDKTSRMALADYLDEQGLKPPAVAYRVGRDGRRDDLDAFLADPYAGLVQALVLGFCFGEESDEPSEEVVEAVVSARERLPRLRSLFLGDITYHENEISWINQSDLTGLLQAFPQLEHFRARGGTELELRKFKHENLKSLAFEAGGLPRQVVRAVGASDLPALEHLELWLGTEEYGADTTVADFKDILSGKNLPKLRYLGLRNSQIADAIAVALAKSPLLGRLRVLDLSLGTLGKRGAEALLAIPSLARLEKIDIHHHYVPPDLVSRLEALGPEVDASEAQEADEPDDPDQAEGYRYVAHSE
jgi:uncharacterized protein (TIGR02996 family)